MICKHSSVLDSYWCTTLHQKRDTSFTDTKPFQTCVKAWNSEMSAAHNEHDVAFTCIA